MTRIGDQHILPRRSRYRRPRAPDNNQTCRLVVTMVRLFAALQRVLGSEITSISNQSIRWRGRYHPRELRGPGDGQTWDGHCLAFCHSAMDIRIELQTSIINSYAGRVGSVLENRAHLTMARLGVVVNRFFATLQRVLELE